jgi:8-amino-7-oxononanoate synthase
MPYQSLKDRLAQIARSGLYRRRKIMETPQQVEVISEGRRLINFCSNDYLGLANHPDVIKAFQEGAERYGVGAGASHLLSGHQRAHHALEEELAEFTGRERALLFSTGYMANLGVISALVGRGDWVFEDRLNHASLLDGARLSGARFKRYGHLDMAALRRELATCTAENRLIVSDGVFSMEGDLAPIPTLVEMAAESGAWLMIDDAHGLGVLGAKGEGVLGYFGVGQSEVPVLVGTLGKAFGTFGAFVAGGEDLLEFLIQSARTSIYTTALPPALAEATRLGLHLAQEETWRREWLWHLIARFREGVGTLGLSILPSETPIQPILLGDQEAALQASHFLTEAGFWVSAIRPPTVPMGTARLRITLTAAHTEEHIDRLLEGLACLTISH